MDLNEMNIIQKQNKKKTENRTSQNHFIILYVWQQSHILLNKKKKVFLSIPRPILIELYYKEFDNTRLRF